MPIRALRAEELAEIELVFNTGLDVMRVRVNEDNSLPDWVGRIGARLRGATPPEHNAITLGNTCYFPVTLMTHDPSHPLWLRDMGWLMHELTHAWQFQHDGLIYLYQAIFKSPTYQYAPPGESQDDALNGFSKAGKVFRDFNREQQGDIVRDYYFFSSRTAMWPPGTPTLETCASCLPTRNARAK